MQTIDAISKACELSRAKANERRSVEVERDNTYHLKFAANVFALLGLILFTVLFFTFANSSSSAPNRIAPQAYVGKTPYSGPTTFNKNKLNKPEAVKPSNKVSNNLKNNSAHSLSMSGAGLIAEFEGFFSRAYNDPVGHCTIGYGTLLHLGPCSNSDIAKWGTIDKTKAMGMLRSETDQMSAKVNQLVKVPLSQNQHDALVSFVYNCGIEAFKRSTLLGLLNKGDYTGAANQLLRWDKASGITLPGLTRRRAMERNMFLGKS